MKTIIGLGNPGGEFEETRHNIGREIVYKIAKFYAFGPFEENKKYSGLVAQGKIDKNDMFLILPNTYMNKSGKSLLTHKAKPKDIVVIHDDSDILLGSCKVAFGKHSAGHKGVESVVRALKTKDFWRIRVGIQKKKRVTAEKLVLQKLRGPEKLVVNKISKKIIELIKDPLVVTTVNV